MAKRARLHDCRHAACVAAAAELSPRDYLKELYPHCRDDHCFMEELTHTYYVHGVRYGCSVSGVWKVFFEEFDKHKPQEIIRKAEGGMVNLRSSLYWLALHLKFLDRVLLGSPGFWSKVDEALLAADAYAALQRLHFDPRLAREEMQRLLSTGLRKPAGRSCYFLVFCAGFSGADVSKAWAMHGQLESLKGTLLHKQAELCMQEFGAWQLQEGRSRVPLRELLADAELMRRARSACTGWMSLLHVAPHTSAELWDHPSTQEYLENLVREEHSEEFQRFEAWLRANGSLTPFRSEWSIYDEDICVAGQIDSLWIEVDRDVLVMADWKRARELLSSDASAQASQAFRKRGLAACVHAPGHPGPCRHLYDCSYNHYFVQQHLYAHILRIHYDLPVARMLLVQCHPEVGSGPDAYHEAELREDCVLAAAVLEAFQAGWKRLLE